MSLRFRPLVVGPSAFAISAALLASLHAQAPAPQQPVLDRLSGLPGYAQFAKMQDALRSGGPVFVSGALTVTWVEEGKAFTYPLGGKMHRFELATKQDTMIGDAPVTAAPGRGAGPGRAGGGGGGQGRGGRGGDAAPGVCPPAQVDRGRQAPCVASPDSKLRAIYKDRNLWIENADGSNPRQVTTDGDEKKRIKYGTGSWVYGEELGQPSAIWWSPDSTKVAFYRFDESPVKDFYLQMTQTQIQSSLDVEAYPKAGAPNPIADILVYDVTSAQKKTFDVRDGKPFTDIPADGSKFLNDNVGHYVYRVAWAKDGSGELYLNRTNRRQQVMEFVACSPATTRCRVIVHEEWPTGWAQNSPPINWLADNKRFIWSSERNGWRNLYLYDVSGKLLNSITSHTTFEVAGITRVDEAAGVVFYTSRDGDNFMKTQLHRVGLDGKGDVRLTDPAFNHTVNLSPDGKFIVDVYQTHDAAPATRLLDGAGKVVAELAKSDLTRFKALGFRPTEYFTYKAADGKTDLWGSVTFPSNFDPSKKYPALAGVYGGPGSTVAGMNETFATPGAMGNTPTSEYGFLVLSLSSRSAPGRGKRMLDEIYMKLGQVEMDDMAAGVRALWSRPYFDKTRVGIHGSSYGGYSSAMSILRHPDVWAAASAASSVTAWYHYDSIYTERYMWIPQENKEGYEAGNAMNYAKNLKGRLLIYYGTADNNVHPNNSMQLIKALQQARKSFEVQVGPDAGHSNVDNQRMMEFFIENLVQRPDRLVPSGGK
jgi:dipeptidyl-peptidase-4